MLSGRGEWEGLLAGLHARTHPPMQYVLYFRRCLRVLFLCEPCTSLIDYMRLPVAELILGSRVVTHSFSSSARGMPTQVGKEDWSRD